MRSTNIIQQTRVTSHRDHWELVAECLKQRQQNKLDESDLGGRLRHLLPVHEGSHGQPLQLLHITLQYTVS